MSGAQMWARVLCFFGIIGLFAALPASAQTISPLPTSEAPAKSTWLKMNPSTFQVSPEAVLEQFDRVAVGDSRLTPALRVKLAAMLKAGEGVVVMVPDGIVLDYLTGRQTGKPSTYRGMKKGLGREDRALLFKLSETVSIYWFTGDKGVSCNNIGVVFKTPPTVVEREDPPKKKTPQCRMVTRARQSQSTDMTFLPPVFIQGCGCCGPLFVQPLLLPGEAPSNNSESILVCE